MNKIVAYVTECAVFALMLSSIIVASPATVHAAPACTTISLLSGPDTQFKHLTLDDPAFSSVDSLFTLAPAGNAVQVVETGWGGSWNSSRNDPRVAGAVFVSNTALQPATPPSGPEVWDNGSVDQWRLFGHSFTIPANTVVTDAVVHYTGDDYVSVFLDDSFIANHVDYAAVTDANITVGAGTHELEFVLENNQYPNNGFWNPTGLIYRADITYCVSQIELATTGDSFLRSGQNNRNEGANPHLLIQSSGHNRAVIAFDEQALADYVAEYGFSSARLVLTIAENGNNWGTGRTVDIHPLSQSFTEGNGKDAGLPGSESTRGNGAGTTWKCATDTAIENQATDCNPVWNGGVFGAATAPSVTHTNGQVGEVEWDVTQDILNGSFGWLIKKTNEGQSGAMEYYSKEGAVAAENMQLAPRLILEL